MSAYVMELFGEPVKEGSVTLKNKNTHTVNGKRLANKRLLLFLRPVALTLFLEEKKKRQRSTHFNFHVLLICLTNVRQKYPQSTHLTSTCIDTRRSEGLTVNKLCKTVCLLLGQKVKMQMKTMALPFPSQTLDRPSLWPKSQTGQCKLQSTKIGHDSTEHLSVLIVVVLCTTECVKTPCCVHRWQQGRTFTLYSQSILMKSRTVWARGPWVAM